MYSEVVVAEQPDDGWGGTTKHMKEPMSLKRTLVVVPMFVLETQRLRYLTKKAQACSTLTMTLLPATVLM